MEGGLADHDVELAIRTFLATSVLFEDDVAEVPTDLQLLDGRVDSLALHHVVLFLEEEFGIELDDSDITERNFATPHDMARLVSSKRS